MSSTRSLPSSPLTSTSRADACPSSEDCVNSRVMRFIHDARTIIDEIEQSVHFHADKNRLETKKQLVELKDRINKVYIECLQCPGGDEEP